MTNPGKNTLTINQIRTLWTRCCSTAKSKSNLDNFEYDPAVLYWMVRGRAVSDFSKGKAAEKNLEQFRKWCGFFKIDPGQSDLLTVSERMKILNIIKSDGFIKGVYSGIWLDTNLTAGNNGSEGWENPIKFEERIKETRLRAKLRRTEVSLPAVLSAPVENNDLPPHERRAEKAPPKPVIAEPKDEEEAPRIPAKKPNCEQADFQVFCLLCGASDRTKKLPEALLRQVFEDQFSLQEVAKDFLDFPDYVRLLAKALGAGDQEAQDFINLVNPDAPKMISQEDQDKIKNFCGLYHKKFGYRGGDPNIYMLSRAIVFRYQAIHSRATASRNSAPLSAGNMRRAIGDLYAVATR